MHSVPAECRWGKWLGYKVLQVSTFRKKIQEQLLCFCRFFTSFIYSLCFRHFSVEVNGVVLEVGAEVNSQEETVYLGWLALSRLDGY